MSLAATPGLNYPCLVHRAYLCGHPDEYIQIDRAGTAESPRILHTIVPQPRIVQGTSARPYRQTRPRCAACTAGLSTARPRLEPTRIGQGVKDGFDQVLARERFDGGEPVIRWPGERDGEQERDEYERLRRAYSDSRASNGKRMHAPIPYEDRVGRRTVAGPATEGHGKVAYVLQTAVHPALAEGLGHELFDDGDEGDKGKVAQLLGRVSITVPRSPNSPRDATPAPTFNTYTQVPPTTPHQPPRISSRHPAVRHPRPASPPHIQRSLTTPAYPATHPDPEIAYHRALALARLEGRTPPSMPSGCDRDRDRYSDTLPQKHAPSPHSSHVEPPSYISHQRPFGPTRSSGGTTLSFGDDPRGRDAVWAREEEHAGVTISTVLEMLYGSSSGDAGGGGDDEVERSSLGSFQSSGGRGYSGGRGSR